MNAFHRLAGSPDGDYQSIVFHTKFAHKANGSEILILSHETGQWQVSGIRFL